MVIKKHNRGISSANESRSKLSQMGGNIWENWSTSEEYLSLTVCPRQFILKSCPKFLQELQWASGSILLFVQKDKETSEESTNPKETYFKLPAENPWKKFARSRNLLENPFL